MDDNKSAKENEPSPSTAQPKHGQLMAQSVDAAAAAAAKLPGAEARRVTLKLRRILYMQSTRTHPEHATRRTHERISSGASGACYARNYLE